MTGRTKPEWIGKTPDSIPPQWVRLRVLDKANNRCACCGVEIAGTWHMDHINPLEDGGENRESNMQPLLPVCHHIKTGKENKRRAKADRSASKAKPMAGSRKKQFQSRNDLQTGTKRKAHPLPLPDRRRPLFKPKAASAD